MVSAHKDQDHPQILEEKKRKWKEKIIIRDEIHNVSGARHRVKNKHCHSSKMLAEPNAGHEFLVCLKDLDVVHSLHKSIMHITISLDKIHGEAYICSS